MAMPEYMSITLLALLGIFALNFAILTFYLYFKLRKQKEKSRIKPLVRSTKFDGEGSNGTNQSSHQSSKYDSNNFSKKSKRNRHFSTNSTQNSDYNNFDDKIISNLNCAMTQGNQQYLERVIKETKQHVSSNSYQNIINELRQAENLLINLQLRQNIETALKIQDIWSIEAAVRKIQILSSKNSTVAKNTDLQELSEHGKNFIRGHINQDTAIHNLLHSDNLQASLSVAEIIGLEKSNHSSKKLVQDVRLRLEISTSTKELLDAIQKRDTILLETAIMRADKIQPNDSNLVKELSRAKMLLDWLSQCEQARLRLKTAIISRCQNLLVIAISKFKDYNLHDDNGDLKTAKKLVEVFNCRTSLAMAMESRDLNVIETCISQAESLGAHHAPELKQVIKQTLLLQKQLTLADELLEETDEYWSKLVISDWTHNQFLIMKVVNILIGISDSSGNENIKIVDLGKDRFKRRIQMLNSQTICWLTCEKVKPMLGKLKKFYGKKIVPNTDKNGKIPRITSSKKSKYNRFYNLTSNSSRLEQYFVNLYEWSDSIVCFVEERFKNSRIGCGK